MPELLLEVGCEELPASMVRGTAEQLLGNILEELRESRLLADGSEGRWYATPRRLIACCSNVLERQPDQTVERRGPAAKAAFATDGSPTPALSGFCRSVDISPADVEVRDDYVWAKVVAAGKPADSVLSKALPDALRRITFEKTMRWGAGRMRFARPIRWIVALFGGRALHFDVQCVKSADRSRGHRFLYPEEFDVKSLEELLSGLRQRFVEPDPEIRAERIRSEATMAANERPLLFEELVEENVYLTEWPLAVGGEFRDEFLQLPRHVLIAAMTKYERFFPIEDKQGAITNQFISICNGGDSNTVRKGNEWVLNARFNDAKFFYDEDGRHTLEDFLQRTERIVFQEKLGTIRMRADRISRLAKRVAEDAGLPDDEKAHCETAGRLCKADLSTGLVSEMPALQGKVGGDYARRDSYADTVCWAIFSHYDADTRPDCAGARAALVVMCADQGDRLAGYLGIGETPSGSSDPYGLRKSVTKLVEAQVGWDAPAGSVVDWVRIAEEGYRDQGVDIYDVGRIISSLREILENRYEALFPEIRHDVRAAAWATGWDDKSDRFLSRARLIAELVDDIPFVRTAKRPANIVSAARKKGIDFGKSEASAVVRELFESQAESALLDAAVSVDLETAGLSGGGRYSELVQCLRRLAGPIDAFFDSVMVMTDNEKVRDNRLRLLAFVDELFRRVGDFSRIVIEGE